MTTPAAAKEVAKKVISVEVLYLDELGYGPQGQHTRREWRAECLENLLAGKAQFEAWQDSWQNKIDHNLRRVSFSCSVTFEDGTDTSLLHKPYVLDFSGCTFNVLDAREFNFRQLVVFSYATFSFATFRDANFCGVYFGGTTFLKWAFFNNARFVGWTNFGFATFGEGVEFSGSHFTEYANFESVTFNRQCRFYNTFNHDAQVWDKATTFFGKADFENATFKNVGHFEGVKFINQIPSFLGVDTASTRLEFSDDTHFAWHDVTEDAVKRLGHLKRLADEHGQIDQALTFNALELHAKAAQPTASITNKLVTGAYALFSNYGRSFGLPIFWLGFMLWLSFLFALGNAGLQQNVEPSKLCVNLTQNITISKPRAAFEYAMFRASGVLDFNDADKQNHTVNCQLFKQPIEPWWMRAWGIFKAIASLGLLFLAALGLRNNYRIK